MKNLEQIISVLASGDLVVMRSDTIYGIFASVMNEKAIQKLYSVRRRDLNRGSVILVDSVATIGKFISLSPETKSRLKNYWPDLGDLESLSDEKIRRKFPATTVILVDHDRHLPWLNDTRGVDPELSFRVPNSVSLRRLLSRTGPLRAPSANLPDQPPARNIAEAEKYFGSQVSLYVDGGEVPETITASRIIKLNTDGSLETVRA